MKKVEQTSNPLLSWVNQAKQYPEHGNGIMYFKGFIEANIWVDCLLYYGDDNLLQGILNHYPFELYPFQKEGSVNILVRPDKRRIGIATALLNVAVTRFKIKLNEQDYTPEGEKFIKRYRKNSFRLSLQKYRRAYSQKKHRK